MKKEKLPRVIILIVLTSITVVFWVFFSIYSAVSKTTPVSVTEEVILPLDPKLDTQTINQMEERIYP